MEGKETEVDNGVHCCFELRAAPGFQLPSLSPDFYSGALVLHDLHDRLTQGVLYDSLVSEPSIISVDFKRDASKVPANVHPIERRSSVPLDRG